MEQFITPENVTTIVALLIYLLFQSKYFATQVDIRDLKLEIADLRDELKDYSDRGDREILGNIDKKYQTLLEHIERIKR